MKMGSFDHMCWWIFSPTKSHDKFPDFLDEKCFSQLLKSWIISFPDFLVFKTRQNSRVTSTLWRKSVQRSSPSPPPPPPHFLREKRRIDAEVKVVERGGRRPTPCLHNHPLFVILRLFHFMSHDFYPVHTASSL